MLSRPKICSRPVELHLGVAHARLGDGLRDAAGETAGERDQARRVALEQLPVDAWAVVVALQVPQRAELDEVAVAGGCLGEQGQVGGALRLLAAVVRDVHLAAEDRLHALAAARPCRGRSRRPASRGPSARRRASRAAPPCRRAPGSCTPRRGSSTRSGRGGGRTGSPSGGSSYCPLGTVPDRADRHVIGPVTRRGRLYVPGAGPSRLACRREDDDVLTDVRVALHRHLDALDGEHSPVGGIGALDRRP